MDSQTPKFKPQHCVRFARPHSKFGRMGIPKDFLEEGGRIVRVEDNLIDDEPMYSVQFFSWPFAFQVRESMLAREETLELT